MKWKTILLAVAGVLAVAAAIGCASARGHHGHDPAKVAKFITWKVNDVLDDLKASDSQRTKVLAVKDRLLTAGLQLHAQQESAHDELERQWRSDQVNVEELRKLADQRLAALRGFVYQGIDALAEVHATLTPAQRTKLADDLKKMHGR
jgi:Spy/CpxP family protein refolding chaperone